jgi:transcription initiation factor TFIID TATA-box-binding protein
MGFPVEVVNITASTNLGRELDLESIAESSVLRDMDAVESIELNRESGERILMYLVDVGPVGILSRKGSFIITGAHSFENLEKTTDAFLDVFVEAEIINSANSIELITQNIVCTGTLDRDINLNALAIDLGLKNTEYEPEQFPGLFYWAPEANGTILVFASGKVVITGTRSVEEAEADMELLEERIEL